MRKLLSFFSLMLVVMLTAITPVYSASVPPETISGNDSNAKDYNPPNGDCFDFTGIVVIFILLIIAFFLLGLLFGASYFCSQQRKCKKNRPPCKDSCKEKECDHCRPRRK